MDANTLTNAIEVTPITVDPLRVGWGEYDNVEMVGQGGMGIVYRVHHRRLQRFEAVKLLRTGTGATLRELERFRFEAEATAALEHPNIVPVYNVGELNGSPYFAMKWIDGGELSARAVEFRQDPVRLASMMARIARALHYAHQQGILHRDLKPSNILLDRDGEPHVTDFGLAKQLAAADGRTIAGGLTASGAVLGTPAYMAPEQARGAKHATIATDVYGLGTILYEVLTGRAPFVGDSTPDVIRRLTIEPPLAPRMVQPEADRDLEAICLKCLEKDPADRYPSAEALAADLELRVQGLPVSVRPTGVRDWLRQVLRRKPESFEGYAWEVKLWFGIIMAVAQPAIFALVQTGATIGWVWAVFAMSWLVGGLVLQRHMGQRFSRLPETEKHSMMVAVGHLLAHVGLTFAYVPFTGPASGVLSLYPSQAAVSGLALFVIGTTHWGRFFYLGLGVMALAPVLGWWPEAAPLLYGTVLTATMWFWAYAVKVTFGGRPS